MAHNAGDRARTRFWLGGGGAGGDLYTRVQHGLLLIHSSSNPIRHRFGQTAQSRDLDDNTTKQSRRMENIEVITDRYSLKQGCYVKISSKR